MESTTTAETTAFVTFAVSGLEKTREYTKKALTFAVEYAIVKRDGKQVLKKT